jgi:hydroxymethylpyrimidine pyrophosphatase-like HAD family hydrolase
MISFSSNPEITPVMEQKPSIITKLEKRRQQGLPPQIVMTDLDGTVYEKIDTPSGHKEKVGDNSEADAHINERNIGMGFVSGRPDWNEDTDNEMDGLGFKHPADLIVAGAGTVIYWRQPNGQLKVDKEFEGMLVNHKVTLTGENEKQPTNYNPSEVTQFIEKSFHSRYQNLGMQEVKTEVNQSIGFSTITVKDMSVQDLEKLIIDLRTQTKGLKIEYSEDLDQLDATGKTFSGWLQIIPSIAGKDDASRFVMDKISSELSKSRDTKQKLKASFVGDASIDIWMLAMGSGEKDNYTVEQTLLGNATFLAQNKLRKVMEALKNSQAPAGWRKAHLKQISQRGAKGFNSIIKAII